MANTLKFFIEGDSKSGEKALGKINQGVINVTSSFAKWGLATTVAIASLSVVEATKFETKMAEVSTLLEDTSGLEGMEQAIKDLAIQYGQFPGDQVEATYSIISAGAKTSADAMQTLEAANRLAIGGVTEVAIAADGLTSTLNAYAGEVESATEVSDSMFVAMKAGKTTIEELSNNIGSVAPIAAEAGVELDELLAATAALTKGGVKTSVAMTGLRQVVASILKPTAEAQKEAKKLGLEFNSTALESKGLQGFLKDLEEKTGSNKDSLTQLFGSVEALGPIFALTGSQSEAFAQIMEQMENKVGATDKAFKKIDETGEQALKRLRAAGDVLAITIGNELLPAVADFANFLIGPTTSGINRVEDAFLFLRAAAFSTLGGIAESLVFINKPLALVEEGLRRLSGGVEESFIFLTLDKDLTDFAAAMEEGAIATFRNRDATELHNIELRKKAQLLRTTAIETEELSIKEKEASEQTVTAISEDSQKIIDSQRKKFKAIEQMAAASVLNEEELETLRRENEIEAFKLDLERLKEQGLLGEELKQEFRDADAQAALIHTERLAEIERNGLSQGAKFNALTNSEKLKSTIKSGAAILAASASSNKQIFQLHKALSLANAAISLPSAVLQSFENGGGYPWGLIPAGLMAIAGATQIAAISGSTFQAHDGIDSFPKSGSFVGNMERGEMILNQGNSEGIRKLAERGLNQDRDGTEGNSDFSLTVNIYNPMFNPDWDELAEVQIKPALDRLFGRDIFLRGVQYING